jgi:hypothetical protein
MALGRWLAGYSITSDATDANPGDASGAIPSGANDAIPNDATGATPIDASDATATDANLGCATSSDDHANGGPAPTAHLQRCSKFVFRQPPVHSLA